MARAALISAGPGRRPGRHCGRRSGQSAGRRSGARGAAVLLAMLLAALAAAIAATVFADQQRWSRSVEYRRDQVQAQALALAAIQWTRQILDDDARTSTLDHGGEPWALKLPPVPVENGDVRGTIVDAQARLNVNALGAGGAEERRGGERIARLFAQRGGPVGAIAAIGDWIDGDSGTRDGGAEDDAYARQTPPALAANAPVVRTAELAAVRGVHAAALAAVAPYLAALPAGTPVNVNTAPPAVLAALADGLTPDQWSAIVDGRARKPFSTVAEFRARLPDGARLDGEDGLAVRSDWFYVTTEARQGLSVARARALVHRAPGRAGAVVWQTVE